MNVCFCKRSLIFWHRILNSKHFGLSNTLLNFFPEPHISKVSSGHTARKNFIHVNWKFVIWMLGSVFGRFHSCSGGCWIALISADLGCEVGFFWGECWSQEPFGLNACHRVLHSELSGDVDTAVPGCMSLNSSPVLWEKRSIVRPQPLVADLRPHWGTQDTQVPPLRVSTARPRCGTSALCEAPDSPRTSSRGPGEGTDLNRLAYKWTDPECIPILLQIIVSKGQKLLGNQHADC